MSVEQVAEKRQVIANRSTATVTVLLEQFGHPMACAEDGHKVQWNESKIWHLLLSIS